MTSREFNARVSEAERAQIIQGPRNESRGGIRCHWQASVERLPTHPVLPAARTWQVFVRPGTINDRVAAISYLRENDPRGWTVPENHPGAAEALRIYGANYGFIDRELTELLDPPHLLVTTPSAESSQDLGDFAAVADASRPAFFRTLAAFDADLYRASVFVTAAPLRVSRVEDRLGFPLPTRNRRFRVHVGQLPTRAATVASGGRFELHRLYLLRVPGRADLDRLYVQQRCFWSLWTANVEPNPFGGFDPFLPPGLVDLFNELTDLVFDQVSNVLETAASTEFWTD